MQRFRRSCSALAPLADFSAGAGGSVVPPGDVVFTGDSGAHGIHHTPFGGLATTFVIVPIVPGDDIVIQPDGDWVHVPDFGGIITAYTPDVAHVPTPSATSSRRRCHDRARRTRTGRSRDKRWRAVP